MAIPTPSSISTIRPTSASSAPSTRSSATALASVDTTPPSPSSASIADAMTGIALDLGRISDRALRAVGEKVAAGTRLSNDDAELLFTSPDLLGVGMLADYANRSKHGDVVTF